MVTLSVHMVTGRPEQILILPGSTYKPLWTGLATSAIFLGLLSKVYLAAAVGLALTTATLLAWTSDRGLRRDLGAIDAGRGVRLPTQYEGPNPPSWWGLLFALTSSGVLFGSLVFGTLHLWVVAPNWPPPELLESGCAAALLAAGGFVAAGASGAAAVRANRRGAILARGLLTLVADGGHALALAGVAWIALVHMPDPTRHAYAAVTGAMLAYLGLHASIGLIFAAYGLFRDFAGYLSPARGLDLRIGALWHAYAAVAGVTGLVVIFALPWRVGS
jgi:cytochrome c oxidase subunit I+III